MDKTVKIDEETYKKLQQKKVSTGIPIKRLIKNSVDKKKEKDHGSTS